MIQREGFYPRGRCFVPAIVEIMDLVDASIRMMAVALQELWPRNGAPSWHLGHEGISTGRCSFFIHLPRSVRPRDAVGSRLSMDEAFLIMYIQAAIFTSPMPDSTSEPQQGSCMTTVIGKGKCHSRWIAELCASSSRILVRGENTSMPRSPCVWTMQRHAMQASCEPASPRPAQASPSGFINTCSTQKGARPSIRPSMALSIPPTLVLQTQSIIPTTSFLPLTAAASTPSPLQPPSSAPSPPAPPPSLHSTHSPR